VAQGERSSNARRRELAAALRRLRVESGPTEQEVAVHLDCPPSRFSRIEAGMATIRIGEVRTLLDLYGVIGDHRDELMVEAQRVRARCWWYPYADLIDASFETQLILEDEAAVLRTYQPNLVPGLLQTERYAWELIGARSDLSLETVRRKASLRTMRQQVLSRSDAPSLAVILDEAVLRRPVGDRAVMREQYGRLAQAANTPGVTIQVLPFQAGPHQVIGPGFHIFEFTGDDPQVVELELLDRVHFVEEPREVAHYASAFDLASSRALDPQRSLAFFEQLALIGRGNP
jgi:transcriptional regulator with XRE-family HTH domain